MAVPRWVARSRLIAYSTPVRRSLYRANSACSRMRTARLLMTSATISMTANVKRYWMSETAKEKYGGTKKKSKDATLMTDARIDGPRPHWIAIIITAMRYIMIRLADPKYGAILQATAVASET